MCAAFYAIDDYNLVARAPLLRDPPRHRSVIRPKLTLWLRHTSCPGRVMRNTIAAILAGLLSCSTVLAAEPAPAVPPAAGSSGNEPARRPLVLTVPREEIRLRFDVAQVRTVSEQPPPDNRNWMERHPTWFGLMVGAGAGAAIGAASCGNSCFPIGTSGAAMVGSWYGAPVGALIGWSVGRSK